MQLFKLSLSVIIKSDRHLGIFFSVEKDRGGVRVRAKNHMTRGAATSPASGHTLVEGHVENSPSPKMERQHIDTDTLIKCCLNTKMTRGRGDYIGKSVAKNIWIQLKESV